MGFELKDESHAVIGCAMEVHRVLGPGLNEKPYENAMVVEFGLREIEWKQQKSFTVEYKGETVGRYAPDLIAFGKIVVDAKAISEITEREMGQMLNYLRVTGMPLGLIINFAPSSLQWKRVALSKTNPSTQEINLR